MYGIDRRALEDSETQAFDPSLEICPQVHFGLSTGGWISRVLTRDYFQGRDTALNCGGERTQVIE
jgi:hypothetical protein